MGVMTMTKDEREAFLAAARVGVLAVASDDAPVLTPIWYSYEAGGDVVMTTEGTSVKSQLLRDAGKASVCVQTETVPYQYVVVEGPVRVVDGVDPAWRRNLAHHYLGAELGEMYTEATMESEKTSVTVLLTPQRWRTTDFSKQWG